MKKIFRVATKVINGAANIFHLKSEKIILAITTQKYWLGALQGFCHSAGCLFRPLISVNAQTFSEILKKETPLIVFIDIELAEKIFNASTWRETQLLLDERNIPLCGIGKILATQNNTVFRSIFTRIFEESSNIDEVLEFVHSRITAANNRRAGERRKGIDRRKQQLVDKKGHDSAKGTPDKIRGCIHVGPLCVDYDAMAITVNDRAVEVSPKEFQLIDLLARNKGRVVRLEEIIKVIWPENSRATKADVHQYIYILRHKLEKDPHKPELLITIKGFGYKLCA